MGFDGVIVFCVFSYLVIIGIAIYKDLGLTFLKKKSTFRILIIITSVLILALIFKNFPIKSEKIDSLFSNLLKVSSILTTLFLAYLYAKIFEIRTTRKERQKDIDKLAYKLTEFRRFLYHLIRSRDFWKDYNQIEIAKHKFKGLTYNDLHNQDFTIERKDTRISDFWLKDNGFSTTRADIYFASDEMVGTEPTIWVFDENSEFNYTRDELERFYEASSVFWYYFDHKYFKHTDGLFDFFELNRDYHIDKMKQHLFNIDSTKEQENIDRYLLAEIGSQIRDTYIFKLHDLTLKNNEGLPTILNSLVGIVTLTIIFGVILPLLFSFGEFNYTVDSYGAFVCVSIIIGCLIWIMLDFKNIITSEIKI